MSAWDDFIWAMSLVALLLPIIACIIKDILTDLRNARRYDEMISKAKSSAIHSENVSDIEMESLLNAHSVTPSPVNNTPMASGKHETTMIQINPLQLLAFNAFIICCYII